MIQEIPLSTQKTDEEPKFPKVPPFVEDESIAELRQDSAFQEADEQPEGGVEMEGEPKENQALVEELMPLVREALNKQELTEAEQKAKTQRELDNRLYELADGKKKQLRSVAEIPEGKDGAYLIGGAKTYAVLPGGRKAKPFVLVMVATKSEGDKTIGKVRVSALEKVGGMPQTRTYDYDRFFHGADGKPAIQPLLHQRFEAVREK